MSYLIRLTLDTGHRSRVGPEVVTEAKRVSLRPVIAQALSAPRRRVEVRSGWPYRLSATAGGRSALIATVWGEAAGLEAPVLTFGVARNSRAGAGLWRVLTDGRALHPAATRPPAPWLAVHMEIAAPLIPREDLTEMPELERGVAWTWLDL